MIFLRVRMNVCPDGSQEGLSTNSDLQILRLIHLFTNQSQERRRTLCGSAAIIGAHRGRQNRSDKRLFEQLPVYFTTLSVQICITLCLLSSIVVGVAGVLKDPVSVFASLMEFLTLLLEAHRQTKSSFWWYLEQMSYVSELSHDVRP